MGLAAFHGQTKIKKFYVKRIQKHIAADHLVRGTGWDGTKGCAIGCSLENYNHAAYETELGIPEWLARLEDTLFEGMSEKKSRTWPEKFLKAIPVGADLEPVKGKFLIIVLRRALETFDHEKYPDVKRAVLRVIELWKRGGTLEEFAEARAAAWAAAEAAAEAAEAEAYDYFADDLLKLLKAARPEKRKAGRGKR